MDIKRWFKEDKGGFGAFLIFVIVILTIYAIQRKDPVKDSEFTQSEIKELKATKMVVARESINAPIPADSGPEDEPKPNKPDSALTVLASGNEPVKPEVKTANIKAKTKPRIKFARRKLSKEDVVRSKLKAGMSVNQIAKATGYEKKYIREIKKRKVCNCK
ncbi:MAG: hypothetical protein JWQ14_1684 [Adhaeribacter sp.]|nr:hypothetical protein [Adhaeribacter sp.]